LWRSKWRRKNANREIGVPRVGEAVPLVLRHGAQPGVPSCGGQGYATEVNGAQLELAATKSTAGPEQGTHRGAEPRAWLCHEKLRWWE